MAHGTGERDRNNLHVAMPMLRKSLTRQNRIIIEHAKRSKPHPLGIIIVGKAKRMLAIEPARLGSATGIGSVNDKRHTLKIIYESLNLRGCHHPICALSCRQRPRTLYVNLQPEKRAPASRALHWGH